MKLSILKAGSILFLLCYSMFCMAQDSLLWKFTSGAAVYSSATISGSSLFIGSGDMNMYSLDKNTGSLNWKFGTKGAVHSTPAVLGDYVYFTSSDGTVYSLHKNNGKMAWLFATRGEQKKDIWDYYLSSPVIEKGIVYTGSGDSSVYALNAMSGALIWSFKTNGIVHATPVVYEGVLYVGSFDGNFYALDAATGKLVWKFKTVGDAYFPLGEIQKAAVVFENTLIFGSRDYNIYALDAKTGTGKWNMKETGSWIIATPFVHNRNIYFGTSDSHRFYCMDAATGEIKWKLPVNMRVYGSACLAGTNIAFGCFNGKMYFVNPGTGGVNDFFQTEESKTQYSQVYTAEDGFRTGFILYGDDYKVSESKILALGSILSTPLVENGIMYFGDSCGNIYGLKINHFK